MRLFALLIVLAVATPALAQETTAPTTPAPAVTPPPAPPVPAGPRALIATSLGDIVLQLDPAHAPATVANFIRYAKERHFDGTCFYRVVPGFVIQAGSFDPQGKGRGVHDPIPLEANNGLKNLHGAVAMARGEVPQSATADFFIDLADTPSLDHDPNDTANTTGFAVFATVVQGMDVVDKIATVPLGGKGPFPAQAPTDPIVITKVTILPAAAP